MSEGSATGMDPRFDPRFQRGYSHEATEVPVLDEGPTTDAAALPSPDDVEVPVAPALAGPPEPATEAAAVAQEASPDPGTPPHPVATQGPVPTRWLWIALAACAGFVVLGSAAFWVQATDPSNYIGGVRAGLDETVRLVVNALAPALVEAGLVGIVVVLVFWALTARRPPKPEERE